MCPHPPTAPTLRRAALCLAVLLGAPGAASAHPGEHLELKININAERVELRLLFSHDLADRIVDFEGCKFRFDPEKNRFFVSPPEQHERIRATLAAFLDEQIAIIPQSEVQLSGTLDALEFVQAQNPWFGVPLEMLGEPEFAQIEAVPPDVTCVLTYPLSEKPTRVRNIWHYYPKDEKRAEQGLKARPAFMAELDAFDERRIVVFSFDEPEVVWHAPRASAAERVGTVSALQNTSALRLPLLSLAIGVLTAVGLVRVWRSPQRGNRRFALPVVFVAGVALGWISQGVAVAHVPAPWGDSVAPDTITAKKIFTALHRNVYRAFDYKKESDIYDVLAQSVSGDLLDNVYNEVYQSLIMREHGGAVAKVHSIDVQEAEIVSSGIEPETGEPAFRIDALWHVYGVVVHWGHFHARTNEYHAVYTIARRGPDWKITGVEMLAQRRLKDDEAGTADDLPPAQARAAGATP